MQMSILINILSALMGFIGGSLVAANFYVVIATAFHKRRSAMRFLSHFSRVVSLLRLSDSVTPSRPYRRL